MKLGTWTNNALLHGSKRKLIVAQDPRVGFFAILDFGDIGETIGAAAATPDLALERLEFELQEDAASEMIAAGVV